jgi:hypothetical protein
MAVRPFNPRSIKHSSRRTERLYKNVTSL